MSTIGRFLSSLLFPWRKRKAGDAQQRGLDLPPPGPSADRLRAAVRVRSADRDHAALNDNAAAGAPTSNGVGSDQNL
jgi:hypothetical protein